MFDSLQHLAVLIMFVFALLFALLFSACAPTVEKIRTVEYINTPTHCTIKMPDRPELDDGFDHFTSNFAKILAYADKLEMALHCCRGDSKCFPSGSVDK